jgi:hypothetical protein
MRLDTSLPDRPLGPQQPIERIWDGAVGIDICGLPVHRCVAHALLPNAVAGALYVNVAPDLQHWIRERAIEYANRSRQMEPGFLALWYALLDLVFRTASGVVVGSIAGHWSHLYLDSQTCFGIPLLCAGI